MDVKREGSGNGKTGNGRREGKRDMKVKKGKTVDNRRGGEGRKREKRRGKEGSGAERRRGGGAGRGRVLSRLQ